MRKFLLSLFFIEFYLSFSLANGVVELENGNKLRGQTQVTSYRNHAVSGETYLGIPYARPPVGDLRWADPQPAQTWEGVYDAIVWPDGCIQTCTLPDYGFCPPNQSEDCLYLNIFTPSNVLGKIQAEDNTTAPTYPVMVFLHGGGFTEGAGGCDFYYGIYLANTTNQIIVTINYRLAALGFLVTPALSGNYGLKDQRLALQWVRDNIEKFGGNSSSVTIFGESAGGMSTAVHLVSPLSAGLFHKAIMESNPVTECQSYNSGLSSGDSFAKAVNCDPSNITCFRSLSVLTIKANSAAGSWVATIDGTVGGQQLPDYPLNLFLQGKFNHVPTILGTNANENALFLSYFIERPLNVSEYEEIIKVTYGIYYKQVLALYPGQENYDNRITLGEVGTHQTWACPGAQIILAINKYNPPESRGYVYYFEHVDSFQTWREPICLETTCHAEELPFIWGTVEYVSNGTIQMTDDEKALTKTMQTYWGQFSATGVPTAPGQLEWPAFLSNTNTSIVFNTPTSYSSSGHLQKYCNFWDSIASSSSPALSTFLKQLF